MIQDDELERIAIRYYPQGKLRAPSADPSVRWDHDLDLKRLEKVIRDLEKLRPTKGTRGDLAISEEWVLGQRLRLELSYLGPYATLAHDGALDEETSRLYEAAERVLKAHQVRVLKTTELAEPLPWFTTELVTVGRALFAAPRAKR
jgi:hypothetical protein